MLLNKDSNMYKRIIIGIAANCKTIISTNAKIINMYRTALGLKLQFLNFKANSLTEAFKI